MSTANPEPCLPLQDLSIPVRLKEQSCLRCAQRKVRCDRNSPCSNCRKSQAECLFVAHAPSRRRKRKRPGEDLLAKLKRYEGLLTSHGINFDGYDGPETTQYSVPDKTIVHEGRNIKKEVSPTLQPGKLILENGELRYVDNDLWTGLSEEFREPKELLPESSEEEKFMASTLNTHHSTNVDEASLLFGSSSPTVNLIDLHPQPVHIFRLWQTFLDNVNPLTKIIHAPTMQQLVLEAAGDLEHVPQGLEALMFAIYTFAVTSLSTIECESMFGEAKSTLLAKYRLGTQQALVGAGFLRSSDLVILQAFVLFLFYDHRSLWAITGVAVRIGQRLGLHRDGTSLGLSIFESEMRRRLWWQIVILDSRSAALSGSGASVMAHLWDTKPHLNINDSDLSPNMREPPLEHGGLTEMTFCMLRLEIGRFMQHSNSSDAFDGGKHSSSSIAALLVERDKTIDELERVFERKFLRFCDPMIPLHVIIAAVARCAICKLRVVAHHPRQYSEGLKTMPQREKDMLFANCLKMVEEVNIVHSNKSTQRYLWHVKVYFQLEALAYTLSALRQRTTGDVVARAWSQLGQLFEHYPEMLIDRKKALFVAIQNMTIKAWKAREAASTCDNRSHSSTTLKPPRLISILLSHRRPTMTASAAALNMDDCSNIQSRSQLSEQHQINDIYPIDQGLVSDISSNYGLPISSDSFQADLDPMDWASWDEILKGSDLQSFDGSG